MLSIRRIMAFSVERNNPFLLSKQIWRNWLVQPDPGVPQQCKIAVSYAISRLRTQVRIDFFLQGNLLQSGIGLSNSSTAQVSSKGFGEWICIAFAGHTVIDAQHRLWRRCLRKVGYPAHH